MGRAMLTKLLNPPDVYDASPFGMSQGVVDLGSGLVFVSGQVSRVHGQTRARYSWFSCAIQSLKRKNLR